MLANAVSVLRSMRPDCSCTAPSITLAALASETIWALESLAPFTAWFNSVVMRLRVRRGNPQSACSLRPSLTSTSDNAGEHERAASAARHPLDHTAIATPDRILRALISLRGPAVRSGPHLDPIDDALDSIQTPGVLFGLPSF